MGCPNARAGATNSEEKKEPLEQLNATKFWAPVANYHQWRIRWCGSSVSNIGWECIYGYSTDKRVVGWLGEALRSLATSLPSTAQQIKLGHQKRLRRTQQRKRGGGRGGRKEGQEGLYESNRCMHCTTTRPTHSTWNWTCGDVIQPNPRLTRPPVLISDWDRDSDSH